jgi:hypothetical protein
VEEKPMKKKNLIKTRDHLMVKVINGVTKAGVHKDHKKEANKKTSRSKVKLDETCINCDFPFRNYPMPHDKHEQAAMALGYCSVSCMDIYSELGGE